MMLTATENPNIAFCVTASLDILNEINIDKWYQKLIKDGNAEMKQTESLQAIQNYTEDKYYVQYMSSGHRCVLANFLSYNLP